MAFTDDEKSTHDGQPIELVSLVGPSASFEYYYASGHDDVSYDGDTYVATVNLSSSLQLGSAGEPKAMSLNLPVTAQVIQDYGFGIPPRSLELTIFRRHTASGDVRQWWKGDVTVIGAQRGVGVLTAVNALQAAIRTQVPRPVYQLPCNHKLFDDQCGLVEATYTFATTVSTVVGNVITVASVDGNPNQYYKAGEIERASDGERRFIVDQTGTAITVNLPFRTLNGSDSVNLIAGCDHTAATCQGSKFGNNLVSFGGTPYVPTNDPHNSGFGGS